MEADSGSDEQLGFNSLAVCGKSAASSTLEGEAARRAGDLRFMSKIEHD